MPTRRIRIAALENAARKVLGQPALQPTRWVSATFSMPWESAQGVSTTVGMPWESSQILPTNPPVELIASGGTAIARGGESHVVIRNAVSKVSVDVATATERAYIRVIEQHPG